MQEASLTRSPLEQYTDEAIPTPCEQEVRAKSPAMEDATSTRRLRIRRVSGDLWRTAFRWRHGGQLPALAGGSMAQLAARCANAVLPGSHLSWDCNPTEMQPMYGVDAGIRLFSKTNFVCSLCHPSSNISRKQHYTFLIGLETIFCQETFAIMCANLTQSNELTHCN